MRLLGMMFVGLSSDCVCVNACDRDNGCERAAIFLPKLNTE